MKTFVLVLCVCVPWVSALGEVSDAPPLPAAEELAGLFRANYEKIQSLHVVQQTRRFYAPYNESLTVESPSGDASWDAPLEIWWQDGKSLWRQKDDAGNVAAARLVHPDGVYEMTVEPDGVTGAIHHGGREDRPPMHNPLLWFAAEEVRLSWANDGRLVVQRMQDDVAFVTLLLEPERNYAPTEEILRRRQTLGIDIADDEARMTHEKGAVWSRTVFGEFHEVLEGLFVPFSWLDASVEYSDGELRLRVEEGRLLAVVVNEPIPARRFTLRFPRNAEVTDYRHEDGLQYTVGPLGFKVTHDTVLDTMAVRVYNYFTQ